MNRVLFIGAILGVFSAVAQEDTAEKLRDSIAPYETVINLEDVLISLSLGMKSKGKNMSSLSIG